MSVYPTASQIAAAYRVNCVLSSGWYRTRGECHGGGENSNSLYFQDAADGEGVQYGCFAECDPHKVVEVMERNTGLQICRCKACTWERAPEATITEEKSMSQNGDYFRRLWQDSEEILRGEDNPARLWMARRNLWRHDVPTPKGMRWIPKARLGRRGENHEGAGAICFALASPESWHEKYPGPPVLQGVELVNITTDGRPCEDGAIEGSGPPVQKRSYGNQRGTVFAIGEPCAASTTVPSQQLVITEGAADILAVCARRHASGWSVSGTSGLKNLNTLLDWPKRDVTIFADSDEEGVGAAQGFRMRFPGVRVIVATGYKDAAEMAAAIPFPALDIEHAKKMTGEFMADGVPEHEARRLAAVYAEL